MAARFNIRRLIFQSNRVLIAYERKYARKIRRALLTQFDEYVETGELIDTLFPVITELYRAVGERYFLLQNNIFERMEKAEGIFMGSFRTWFEVYLQTHIAEKITAINETTTKELREVLDIYIRGTHEWDVATDALRKSFGFSKQRAMMIARTEIGNANNKAKQKSADDWEKETGTEQFKMWIHRGARKPRDWHLSLDGTVIPKNQNFTVFNPDTGSVEYMDRPHDENGTAENVINCGCEVIYISERYAKENNMI